MSHLHPSTCNEKKTSAEPGNSSFCSLTYNRQDQQDAADDDGDDDCGLSSSKVQHRNCVVELSNLDLGREEKQELSSMLPSSLEVEQGGTTGQCSADLRPRMY